MHQPLTLPHRPASGVIVGPSFGSLRVPCSCSFVLRASTSSEPEPSDEANDKLKRARQLLDRKQKILDAANQALDSLLMDKARSSPSEIAEAEISVAKAKLDVAEAEISVAKAKRDIAEADLEAFLKENPRPSSSDVAATRDFDINEGRFKRDLAQAEWTLSRAELAFAQARNAPVIDLEQKRKTEEFFRTALERLVTIPGPGQSAFLYLFETLQQSC